MSRFYLKNDPQVISQNIEARDKSSWLADDDDDDELEFNDASTLLGH